jgi:hypothetical protein
MPAPQGENRRLVQPLAGPLPSIHGQHNTEQHDGIPGDGQLGRPIGIDPQVTASLAGNMMTQALERLKLPKSYDSKRLAKKKMKLKHSSLDMPKGSTAPGF